MNQPHLVPASQAAVSLSFVMSAQDNTQTLTVLLSALAKLVEPGSAAHDLAAHALLIASTLESEVSDMADAIH
jgi:hypothetical protein